MMDYMIIGIVAVLLISAVTYIVKAKKKGVKCIGCSSGCSCHNDKESKEHSCSCK